MSEVVIVGGGPVGLWTACQLKKRRPDWSVTVYERYESYQRSHVLRLDHWSMLLYGRNRRTAGDTRQDAFYREVTGMDLSGVAWRPAGSLFIRTNDLEGALKRYARDLGVELRLQRVDSVTDVAREHPNCRRFIAADGAHSRLRAELLGANAVTEHPLQHIVEVKYQVRGTAARLGSLDKQLGVNRRLKHLAFEYVGRERDGLTPVTLRFFVDEATYRSIPAASFKEPLGVDHPNLPTSLREDIAAYMQLRSAQSSEQYCLSTGRATKLVLSLYSAREFALMRGEAAWFLVGDAAMGVPYFRALNSGMILSSRLCQILASENWPISGKLSRQLLFYRLHRPLHIATEFGIARSKDFAVQAYDWARQWGAGAASPSEEDSAPDLLSPAWSADCRQSS